MKTFPPPGPKSPRKREPSVSRQRQTDVSVALLQPRANDASRHRPTQAGVTTERRMGERAGQAVFTEAARCLSGAPGCGADASALLHQLGYVPGTACGDAAALLRAAGQLPRLFRLAAPSAPGVALFGAEVQPVGGLPRMSASGAGLSQRAAFEGCVGEAVELASQAEAETDVLMAMPVRDGVMTQPGSARAGLARTLASLGVAEDTSVDWITAHPLAGGPACLVPADFCLRRRPDRRGLVAPFPLSIGCAAGRSYAGACLHAVLELIERDAAANWWRGGRRGRMLPPDSDAQEVATQTLRTARRGQGRRQTWLLDISSGFGIACVAALSLDASGGGFACGTAAGLSLAQAARSAILELVQMELAQAIAAAKRRERGEAGLSEAERAHLVRHDWSTATESALLQPMLHGCGWQELGGGSEEQSLQALAAHLARHGLDLFVTDLTRQAFGIPVVRVLCPALDQEPSRIATPRLQAAIANNGAGTPYARGISLM